ncbi:MAG: response regulator transcription factor [Syntrophorhabdales bacterium]|jgi:two-component system phosphate regulon response regulator PhoB/two-component system alkaline phosphatase synthesis response regulator PhoP
MNELIAVLDDEPDILELVSVHLKKNRFRVREFPDAESFYRFLRSEVPDLIILDLMLPDADGFEVCKYLRKTDKLAAVPIIMLTARVGETDKILGLELGADDYVTKPFSPSELVARVKAVLRRREPRKEDVERIDIEGILSLDLQRHEVRVKGGKVDLTSTEFRILQLLASKKGWVFSRDKILDYLWGNEKTVVDRTVDVHVKHLREKLGTAAKLIKNIRGVGYKLEA